MADPNRHSSMYGSEAMNLRTQIDDDDEDEDVAGAEESIDNPQARFEDHVIEDRAVVVMNGVQDVHHNHLYVPGSDFAPVAAGGGGGGGSGAGGVDQLTLSFQGEVYVFDAVSPEKVQAVLLLLGGYEVPTGIPAPGMVPPNQRGLPDFTGRSSQPQRATSLSRFREKRKERCFDKKIRYTVRKEVALSSFTIHLRHKLSKEEVDNLTRRKWKYDWETPAFDMPSCRWMGTGESFTKLCGLKQKLCKHWLESFKTSGGDDFHSSKQRLFFSLCNSYRDILHCNKKPFYLKGQEEDSCIMDAYIMHALNHIFRTRDLVTKNDAKVAKHQETVKEEILTGESFLDHGFTRPKVLIILPLASTALRVVKRLIQLTPSSSKVNVEHIDRFADEFGAGVVEDDKEQNELSQKVQDYENSKAQKSSKPSDFQALFGANNNDHFMIGIKFTRRTIKLYGDFYSSDMIIASPLGLITKIGEAEVEKEKDVDYLSSIEVLVIDHADVISMQNWSHVNSVVEQLNRLPSKQHGTDIMRIRQWYLDGHARFYRQTIILGSYLTPDINALFNHHCVNYKGKMKLVCEYKGALAKVLLQVRQIYERFDVDSIVDSDDARFEYFTEKVFPKIKDSIQGGIMLFVSSYFEYVRIRNFLKSQNASFCLLGEYTKQSDISRARVWFFEGNRKIMLYTERAHFYHRYKIRGIQNLIIYSLPERKEFYPEVVNMLEGSHNMTCTALFSHFDQFRLERIVGSRPAKRMVASEKNVFVFC